MQLTVGRMGSAEMNDMFHQGSASKLHVDVYWNYGQPRHLAICSPRVKVDFEQPKLNRRSSPSYRSVPYRTSICAAYAYGLIQVTLSEKPFKFPHLVPTERSFNGCHTHPPTIDTTLQPTRARQISTHPALVLPAPFPSGTPWSAARMQQFPRRWHTPGSSRRDASSPERENSFEYNEWNTQYPLFVRTPTDGFSGTPGLEQR